MGRTKGTPSHRMTPKNRRVKSVAWSGTPERENHNHGGAGAIASAKRLEEFFARRRAAWAEEAAR